MTVQQAREMSIKLTGSKPQDENYNKMYRMCMIFIISLGINGFKITLVYAGDRPNVHIYSLWNTPEF